MERDEDPRGGERIRVLVEDPDLGARLEEGRREVATRDCVAPVVRIEAGVRPLQVPTPRADFAIGLLVLDGLLMRRVGLDGRYGAELLGEGDLLRPWQRDDLGTTPAVAGEWRLLRPCRIAVLEAGFALRLGHYPEVTAALFDRTVRRSRQLAVNMAIVHQPRVEVRLRILLWMLAGRWGRRVPEGLRLPLPLTHAILGELIAAQRQTVSTALGELARLELVLPEEAGWLLRGAAPPELQEVAPLLDPDPTVG
ncbi:MAG: Crp/Fnr family transcriptional regulator [Actinobacteria bacterium]|nr:Crp/Fnr family transcriptional regulator [Actinomycetota bacterium]